jgi:hypothetical protein
MCMCMRGVKEVRDTLFRPCCVCESGNRGRLSCVRLSQLPSRHYPPVAVMGQTLPKAGSHLTLRYMPHTNVSQLSARQPAI